MEALVYTYSFEIRLGLYTNTVEENGDFLIYVRVQETRWGLTDVNDLYKAQENNFWALLVVLILYDRAE